MNPPPRSIVRVIALGLALIGFFLKPSASAQVTIDFHGLYTNTPSTVVTNANGDPIAEALSTTSMWWLCLDINATDPWLEHEFNLSDDSSILQTGVWASITDPTARETILQSITNIFFNNQTLITSTPYEGGDSYNDSIFAFQKAAWILIHDYDAGYYTGTFDNSDLLSLITRDAAIEDSIVADYLLSSSIYNPESANGRIFFGEGANPEEGLQDIMLITAVPVPEPSAAILAILGAGFFVIRKRR